jgi:hypothetical protein
MRQMFFVSLLPDETAVVNGAIRHLEKIDLSIVSEASRQLIPDTRPNGSSPEHTD